MATRKAQDMPQDMPQDISQAIQMTMTGDEFAMVAMGLALVMAVRMKDAAKMGEGLGIVHALPDYMVEALDTIAEKVQAGWAAIVTEEA